MKKNILSILLVFVIQLASAQEFTNLPIEITAPSSKKSWVFSPSKEKALWITQNTNETLSLQELDSNLNIIHSQIVKVAEADGSVNTLLNILAKEFHEFKGGIYANNKYHLLFASGRRKKAFQLLSYTPKSGKVSITNVFDFDKKERLITTTSHNNEIYLITVLRHSSELIIRRIGNDLKLEKKQFALNELNRKYMSSFQGDELLQSSLFDELVVEEGKTITSISRLDISVVDSSGYSHLQMENAKVKIYFLGNKIYLTVDAPFYKLGTNLFELDMETGAYKSEIVVYPSVTSDRTKQNSFIHDNKIFSLKASSKEVKVNICDFKTREVIKELVFTDKAKEIPFANTPLLKLGYGWDATSQSTLSKPKQIVNRMMRQNTAVSASTDKSNNLVLSIGSYNYFVPNYSYTNNAVGLNPNPFNQMYVPQIWRISTRVKTAYFQSKFNKETLANEAGQLEESEVIARQRKVWRYKKQFKSANLSSVYCGVSFELNNKLYFGHYRKAESAFRFARLK